VEREPKLAILSPFHYTLANRPIYNPSKGVEEVFTIMTSGNLLRLDLWEELGGFREEFFIDMVDIEFSLRLQQKGYKIKVCHPVRLFHNMGQSKEVKFLWKRLVTPQYPPIREYYRIRNGFTLVFSNLTPLSQKLSLLKHWFVDIIFLAPYEDSFPRNLLPKGKAVLWGIRDFLRGRYGKLSEKEENELRINSRK
jgi:rhamnosyltransferase